MSTPIIRLFSVFVVLFGVLIGFTSYWSVWDSEQLNDHPANRRALLEEAMIERGRISARDGTTLARSQRIRTEGDEGLRTYRRVYPRPDLFPHEVGYSFIGPGNSGLEEFYNDELSGREEDFESIVEQLEGRDRVGDDLRTTLDPEGQRVALNALAGRPGSIVALEPDTGNVRVMASIPGFDPNEFRTAEGREAINRQPGSPLLNRSTDSGYAPGSTFKVVTAAAALDSGQYTPQSTVDGSNGKVIGGTPLNNFGGQDFGSVDLTTALTFSVNTAWATVGVDLGAETMQRYMERFGFYERPPLDLPADSRRASGVRGEDSELVEPESGDVDIGRMAIGQGGLEATPLQMAMVAATVANGGVLVRPHIGDRIIDPDGRTRRRITGRSGGRVISGEAAGQLTAMMTQVVREGSGVAAALGGAQVAGKTGTAERIVGEVNQPWFIGFAPANDPQIAIAVTVERSTGTGGEVAAPMARQVLEALL